MDIKSVRDFLDSLTPEKILETPAGQLIYYLISLLESVYSAL